MEIRFLVVQLKIQNRSYTAVPGNESLLLYSYESPWPYRSKRHTFVVPFAECLMST